MDSKVGFYCMWRFDVSCCCCHYVHLSLAECSVKGDQGLFSNGAQHITILQQFN